MKSLSYIEKKTPRTNATMSAMDLDAPVSIAPQFREQKTSAT